MVDQTRAIDKQKLGKKTGELNREQIEKVERILREFLALSEKIKTNY